MQEMQDKMPRLNKDELSAMEITGRYYVHGRGANGRHPLVDCVEPSNSMGHHMLFFEKPIGANIAPLEYKFAPPIPRNAELADHHKEPDPIVSDKIKDAIAQMVEKSAEFVPAQIQTKVGAFPYWVIHSLKSHDVLDRVHSNFEASDDEFFDWIERLLLDFEKLADIPKNERLLFQLGGSAVVWLWHEDVVRAVEATGATGIGFSLVEGYGQDAVFGPKA